MVRFPVPAVIKQDTEIQSPPDVKDCVEKSFLKILKKKVKLYLENYFAFQIKKQDAFII